MAKQTLHLWIQKKFMANFGMRQVLHVRQRSSVCWMKKWIQTPRDKDGLTILSSISDLFFDCEFDEY